MFQLFRFLFIGLMFLGCSHKPVDESPRSQKMRIPISSSAPLFQSPAGNVPVGGLSDLVFSKKESTPERQIYLSITDRGPNGEPKKIAGVEKRPFFVPDFSPTLVKIAVDQTARTASVVKVIPLRRPDGSPLSGRPNVDRRKDPRHFDEIPVDAHDKSLAYDPWGIDSEGLALAEDGSFWVSEEYGPSLLKVNPEGRVLQRWLPRSSRPLKPDPRAGRRELPEFLADRRENRGFEALTWSARGTLLLFLQSEIPLHQRPDLAPVIEFDPASETTVGVYFYPLSPEGGKIGAATLTADGRVLVLEQNGHTGLRAWQRVFAIDFKEADNQLAEASKSGAAFRPKPSTRPLTKRLERDLGREGLARFEKLEGMTLDEAGGLVLVNDNDFGVSPAPDKESGSELIFLGRD